MSATGSFAVSAANSYNLTGPYPFETEFSDMEGSFSPTVNGSTLDGRFVFNPPKEGSVGGRIQITFRNVNSVFEFVCLVSNTVEAQVIISDSNAGSQKMMVSSTIMNGVHVVRFNTVQMRGKGDLAVILTAPNETRKWAVQRCDVTPI